MNTGMVNYGSALAAEQTAKADKTAQAEKKGKVAGRTVGNPELSEKAAKYYEQLKSKFGNMEFVLVSKDMKEQAQACLLYTSPSPRDRTRQYGVCVSEQGYEGTGTGQCFFLCKYVKDRCSHR